MVANKPPRSTLFKTLKVRVTQAVWSIPAGMVVGAILLAGGCLRLDQELRVEPHPDRIWLYSGGPEGASAVLTVIASSTITVAGVIFSVQFVVLQLASSQYTPRVIRSLAKRPALLAVLGTFLSNFVFSLLVLRSVRTETGEHAEFVPVVSTSIAIILALLSVAVLIYFIYFGAKLVQPGSLFSSAMQDTTRLLRESPRGEPVDIASVAVPASLVHPGILVAGRTGYIQSLDLNHVGETVGANKARIQFDQPVGAFVMQGEPVGSTWSESGFDSDMLAAIAAAYKAGNERTPEQDVEFGFRRLADIALKALSPAINDPTTAIGCIDGLCAGLVLFANAGASPHRHRISAIHGSMETVHVIWMERSFHQCLDVSFSQIRLYGARDSFVMSHLVFMLGRIADRVGPQFRPALAATAEQVRASALNSTAQPTDRARIERAATWLINEAPVPSATDNA